MFQKLAMAVGNRTES